MRQDRNRGFRIPKLTEGLAAFIPLWILPASFGGLAAGAFWIQFCVQGALGVVSLSSDVHIARNIASECCVRFLYNLPSCRLRLFAQLSRVWYINWVMYVEKLLPVVRDIITHILQMVSSASAQIEASTSNLVSSHNIER